MKALSARLSKSWLVASILWGENLRYEEQRPLADREFRVAASMLFGAFALFALVMRALAS